MSRRRAHRLVPALCVCTIALVPGCGGGDEDAAAPPSAPAEFAAAFEVDAALEVVAGNDQAWVLATTDGGAAVSRVDHTGRLAEVADLTGQSHVMAPYGDGVVVARVTCDGDQCEETVTKVLVLDAEGSTVAEEEFAREPGAPEAESGTYDQVRMVGVDGEVIWLETSEGLVSYEPGSGRTGTGRPDTGGADWVPAASRLFDPGDYQSPPSLTVPPEAVAAGRDDQVFVLQAPGVVRRVVGPPRAPFSEEELRVPADVFYQEFDAVPRFSFDTSPTVVVGCIAREYPLSSCWLGSP